MRVVPVIVALCVVLGSSVRADIVSWTDADGVVHYTNVSDEVPAAMRANSAVVVVERPRPPAEATVSARDGGAEDGEARTRGQGGDSDQLRAYIAGLQQGMAVAQAPRTESGPVQQINGPLVVTEQAPAPVTYDPYWAYGQPLVTTGFDRGRSRHLTLRLLLQDQFAIDREGPYGYVERFPPPLGPRLAPFMRRGLPSYTVPYGGLVVTR